MSKIANNQKVPQTIIDFLEMLRELSKPKKFTELTELYSEKVYIEFNHQSIAIPYNELVRNELENFVETMIKEY